MHCADVLLCPIFWQESRTMAIRLDVVLFLYTLLFMASVIQLRFSQIRTRCTIWYMSLWNTLSFDYSFVTISWRNKNISLIKIQSITKNHIRDLFQFISSTSTFVTQKLGSRNDLIPIHKFVSKGNFSSDTFSSWN